MGNKLLIIIKTQQSKDQDLHIDKHMKYSLFIAHCEFSGFLPFFYIKNIHMYIKGEHKPFVLMPLGPKR